MAGGLNKSFLEDRQNFLTSTSFAADDNAFTNGSGVYTVGFETLGGHVLLRPATSTSKYSNKFSCYFLKAVANNLNIGANFPNGESIMFTSNIQGCQFLAYGASRAAPAVEHNNDIDGTGQYDARYNAVAAGAAHKIRFGNGNGYVLDDNHSYNLFGLKANGGAWTFYVQTLDYTDPGAHVRTVQTLAWT